MYDKELGEWLRDNEATLYKMAGSALIRLGWDPHPQMTELVVAETMWRVWEYRDTYTGGSVKAWVNTAVYSSCLELRRQWLRDRGRDERFVKVLGFERHTEAPDATLTRRETITEAMTGMDAAAQRAIYLKFLGYDYDEIAHEMGISRHMAHKALNRGRRVARSTVHDRDRR